MSQNEAHEFDSRLLDYHLGQLSPQAAVDLMSEVARDPQMARDHATLQSVFAALASVRDTAAPAGLGQRIAARVRAGTHPAPRLASPAVARPRIAELAEAAERRPDFVLRFSNLRDIIAIAAMIVLAVGIGVPSVLHVRERNQRIGCSANLAAIGRGLQAYATTYGSSIPFAGWQAGRNSWKPVSTPGVESVPNRRHVYPLLQARIVSDPRLFVCPGRMDVPMPQQQITENRDFPESRNISYAYFNMAGVRPTLNDRPGIVVMADDTPLFDNGLPLYDIARISRTAAANENSKAHRGAGQNTLTLDGKVIWSPSPFCGIDGDNIWTLSGADDYTGREGPSNPNDSHLLK